MGVHRERGLVAELQAGGRPRGDEQAVPDAGDVDHEINRGVSEATTLGDDAAQRPDHGRAPR
jgi:hypothetical protein